MRDPYNVIGLIPEGLSYQWVAFAGLGEAEWDVGADHFQRFVNSGWAPVPPVRHPMMPCVEGRIVVGGQVLMERPAAASAAAQQKALDRANRNVEEAKKRMRQLGSECGVDVTITTSESIVEFESGGIL